MTTTLRISVLIALGVGLTQFHTTGSAQPKPAAPPTVGPTAATTALLDQPCKLEKPVENVTIAELFQKLSDLHGVTFRLDVGYIRSSGVMQPYETKITLPIVKGLSVRDVLREVIDGFPAEGDPNWCRLGIQVRGSQVILSRGFMPPTIPGAYKTEEPGNEPLMIARVELQNMLYGPTVSLTADKQPLADVIGKLRESSGANIVVDPRVKDKLITPVTLTVNDARLMTVLKIVGDMCDVAPAVVDNVYYLTTRENAERLTRETERTVFGEPRVPIPAGFVTDGVNLFEKPANLKLVDPNKLRPGTSSYPAVVVPSKVPESVVRPLAPVPTTPEKK